LASESKVRLSLDLSPQTNSLLERVVSDQGTTKSDVLRKAIALVIVAEDARREGRSLGVIDANKQLVAEIVGF
jgi:BioD-like phosphotransacetylase family protein